MFTNPRGRTRSIALFTGLVALTALVAQARTSNHPDPVPPVSQGPARIEVAFVLDTTGSMAGLIEGAKQKIWSIANQMASSSQQTSIRIGLIGYRDRGDTYVTRRFDLTEDIDAIYGHLRSFSAGGGGDTPESVNQALHEAVTSLGWSQDEAAYKVVFLVGDAPPQMNYPNDVKYPTTLSLARKKGIAVNTIQCGAMASTQGIWREIAQTGRGEYVAIQQDGAMVALTTPMDDELARLNRELADTVVAYGGAKEKKELEDKITRSVAASPSVAASRLSYLKKRGGVANLGRKDLVDAVKAGEVDLDSVAPSTLPAEMQVLGTEEREAYLAEKSSRRRLLQGRIAELVDQRDGYVRSETERLEAEGKGDGFDHKVFETIRSQAAEKGISYE